MIARDEFIDEYVRLFTLGFELATLEARAKGLSEPDQDIGMKVAEEGLTFFHHDYNYGDGYMHEHQVEWAWLEDGVRKSNLERVVARRAADRAAGIERYERQQYEHLKEKYGA